MGVENGVSVLPPGSDSSVRHPAVSSLPKDVAPQSPLPVTARQPKAHPYGGAYTKGEGFSHCLPLWGGAEQRQGVPQRTSIIDHCSKNAPLLPVKPVVFYYKISDH